MAACSACGTQIPEGGKFCPACGAAAPTEAPVAEAGACAGCGAELKPGARFCASCGTPVAVAAAAAQPAAPPPATCAGCGQELAPGRAFCSHCGTPAGGAPAAAPPPVQPAAPAAGGTPTPGGGFPTPATTSQPSAPARSPRTPRPRAAGSSRVAGPQIGILVAFLAAAISTALPWVSAAGLDFNTWDDGARFRFGDWFELDNGDGYVIVLVAIIGGATVLGPVLSPSFPRIQFAPAAVGAAILIIAGLEWYFINDQGQGLDPAYGVYVLGAAGIAAAVLGYTADKAPPGVR